VDTGRGELPKPDKGDQRSIIAVKPDDRVLQILAGPGSGKTEMLVWRVLYDLCVLGAESNSVMVTTFTRRAATELNVRVVERADQLLVKARKAGHALADPQVHNLRIGTIHSLCDSLLAEFDDNYMAAGTELIDEVECIARLAQVMSFKLGYNSPQSGGPPRTVNRLLNCRPLVSLFRSPWEANQQWPVSLMDRITFVQGLLNQQIETWHPRCASARILNGIEVVHNAQGLTDDLCRLQDRWEKYLDENQVLDFATVQKRFLQVQPRLLSHLQHVFVDEFQDNNPIQFAIHTAWLANQKTRLTVVGDDDQALYRFRGSDIRCFADLQPYCQARKISYRQAKLEENYRSTRAIIVFSQAYKASSSLHTTSMQKHVRPGPAAKPGDAVRLLRGPWHAICQCVTSELKQIGAGRIPPPGKPAPPSAAILMFSTSERSDKSAARTLRMAIDSSKIRVYNPRNKTAADEGSPVFELMGLISYLIDPVSVEPAGKSGRMVMVAASMNDRQKWQFAKSEPPPFPINESHLNFQKKFAGGREWIGNPPKDRRHLFAYLDDVRKGLVNATQARMSDPKSPGVRLSLAGLVARLLSMDRYRKSGFTEKLFRQALFTGLLEAHTAPTRRTMEPLDAPLEVSLNAQGKYVWPKRYWNFLNICGSFLDKAPLDDEEVEAFEQHAVLLLTFHQSKGLEFDHVYVAGTGRHPDLSPALRTMLFSGDKPSFNIDSIGGISCKDAKVVGLAQADRDREVYVGVTRARSLLTILHDPKAELPFLTLNPAISGLFKGRASNIHPASPLVEVAEYVP
jgi:DNA helicase-2/ATP-dependent DNA helicase PcrA